MVLRALVPRLPSLLATHILESTSKENRPETMCFCYYRSTESLNRHHHLIILQRTSQFINPSLTQTLFLNHLTNPIIFRIRKSHMVRLRSPHPNRHGYLPKRRMVRMQAHGRSRG